MKRHFNCSHEQTTVKYFNLFRFYLAVPSVPSIIASSVHKWNKLSSFSRIFIETFAIVESNWILNLFRKDSLRTCERVQEVTRGVQDVYRFSPRPFGSWTIKHNSQINEIVLEEINITRTITFNIGSRKCPVEVVKHLPDNPLHVQSLK